MREEAFCGSHLVLIKSMIPFILYCTKYTIWQPYTLIIYLKQRPFFCCFSKDTKVSEEDECLNISSKSKSVAISIVVAKSNKRDFYSVFQHVHTRTVHKVSLCSGKEKEPSKTAIAGTWKEVFIEGIYEIPSQIFQVL